MTRPKRKQPQPHVRQVGGTNKNDLAIARAGVPVKLKIIESFTKIAVGLITAGGSVSVAYFLFRSVQACAGKDTHAVFSAILGLGLSKGILAAVATATSGGFIHQRHVRKKQAVELGEYVAKLEKIIDKQRSSSGLTQPLDVTKNRPKELS
jgi:hypothetical protein